MATSNTHTEIHLKDYIEVLRRRRDVAIAFFVSTVLVVTIGSFIMKPVYRATVTILIDPESPNVLTASGMVALKSDDYLSYKEYFQSQMEIFDSQSLGKKVFDDFKLGQTRDYRNAKEPVKSFLKTIRVDPIPDTRLIKLNVDNEDPQLAADIANRIAELYVMRNLYYISKNELMNLLKNEYLKLETKAYEYGKVYKEAHPEMIKLKTEMADMAGRMSDEKRSVYDYNRIEDYLTKDSRSTLAGFKANNVSIQDPAEKPVRPIKPKKRLNILLAIILGSLGGIGLAFFLEYLDDSVKTVDDVERIAEWPLLGNIPVIEDDTSGNVNKDIFVDVRPKDPISEAYKSIRTRVLFASTEERPLKSIMITSPGPQEGKTLTLCNLAIAMAQNNKSVLIVDADMRKPRLHEVFGIDNSKGLSSFLSGQASFDDVIRKVNISNINLITGGIMPPNPSELLASHKLVDLIDKAKARFDCVFIDSPPVGMLTDAILTSRAADGTIVTIESGKTSKRVLGRIYQMIGQTHMHVVGVVLNKMPHTPGNGYYSYYYGNK
jgi:capsular exopolysaccharide synthesis family protein